MEKVLEQITAHWAVLTSIIGGVFVMGGFAMFVRVKLKVLCAQQEYLQGKVDQKHRSVDDSLEKQRTHTDEDVEKIRKELDNLGRSIERLSANTDNNREDLKQCRGTYHNIYQKIDEMKKDFVSVQRYDADQKNTTLRISGLRNPP